jgi:hypothetical protein
VIQVSDLQAEICWITQAAAASTTAQRPACSLPGRSC